MAWTNNDIGGIIFSQYTEDYWSGEHFIKDHAFMYIQEGVLQLLDAGEYLSFTSGEMLLVRKNSLARLIKRPPPGGGRFLAVNVFMDEETLKKTGMEMERGGKKPHDTATRIKEDAFLKNYLTSLAPYQEQAVPEDLVAHKIRELVMLLVRNNPELKTLLFDFAQPGKIDLKAFMLRNFRYNVTLDKLAYLTGRSLATFKRDFEKIFDSTPSRWLREQRLKEAHFLISEKKVKPSDAYLEVGFESLAHFSYAFKQYFGKNPSAVG